MENQLQTIVNTTLNVTIRTLTIEGEPWFVAKDICAALEHTNVTVALGRLDDDEKGITSIYTLGGAQKMSIVNEFGLYNLILGSRKPEAKMFKRWVTHEVLPYSQDRILLTAQKAICKEVLLLMRLKEFVTPPTAKPRALMISMKSENLLKPLQIPLIFLLMQL